MSPRVEPATIVIHAKGSGFFSNFNCVMSNLKARLGREGCVAAMVDWSAGDDLNFAYGGRQDGNAWLHFFEPLNFADLPSNRFDVWHYPMTADFWITGNHAYSTYKFNPFWRRRYHDIFSRYVIVKPYLTGRVEAIFSARMAGKFCLGVHYRNPRHSQECPDPIPPPDIFVAKALALLRGRRDAVIFLATDFEPAVTAFQAAFGAALVLQPEVRRADAQAIDQMHHIADPELALGEQVLVDCLLLARCHMLLHVTSNVATAAGYINPRMRMVYCETREQAWQGYKLAARLMLKFWAESGWRKPVLVFIKRLRGLARRLLR